MLSFKVLIIYATLACVSVAVDKSLDLQGDVVYGQSFNLVCFTETNSSYYSGTFFRNVNHAHPGIKVASVFYKNSCSVGIASFTNYSYSCSNEGKNITLTVSAENEAEHNTFWRCANQVFPNENTNNVINVFVNDPVRSVTIRNNTVVNVTEGISETFVCESSPCRPDAGIYWMKNTINITDTQASSSINQSGSKSITLSNLQFTAVRTDNGSILTCGAYNGFGSGKFSANVTVIVHYSPIVKNFTSPIKVIQCQPLEIVCSADGNPTPQLTWTPVGEDKVNKSRLYYSAVSRDNAVIHTCTATNNMVPTNGNPQIGLYSKQLLIDVLFPPIINNFTSTVKAIQGQPLVVICSADGNPSPQMSWDPEGEDNVNKSRLYYSAISRNKAVVHICTATNNMLPTTGNQQQGSDYKELHIDVLYPPTVRKFELPVEAVEGQTLVMICSADGNPSPQISWNPEGEDKVNKSRLYYSAISRNNAVVHRCTATNNMVPTTGIQQAGSDFKQLLINVLYNASVSAFTSKDNIFKISENGSLQLQCQVDSNPYSVISLFLENELKLKVENALSLNYTKRAACIDAGTYICSAKNEIMNGKAVSKSIQIHVICYPRLDNRRNISTEHYGALGENVILEVYFIAHPEPADIAWYRREKETDMWQPFPYQSPSFNGSYSSIIVHLATARDFGNYMVNMSNDLGIYSRTYLIKEEMEPETPAKFHITDIQEKQVTLQWLSGDHRGFDQTFVIQVSMDNNAWLNASLINAGKKNGWFSETITGLKSNTVYYIRLYSFNVIGGSTFADIIVATRTLKESASSLDIGTSIGIGFGGFFLGVFGTISVIIIWKRITVTPKYNSSSEADMSTDMQIYVNTGVSSSPAPSHYEELQQDRMEKTIYNHI